MRLAKYDLFEIALRAEWAQALLSREPVIFPDSRRCFCPPAHSRRDLLSSNGAVVELRLCPPGEPR